MYYRISGFAALLLLTAVTTFAGCGTAEDPRGTRVAVSGSVTLDGRPLDRARIVFHSAEGEDRITATGSIVNGQYQIPAEHGPLVGAMRVEIRPETIDLAEFEAARQSARRHAFSLDAVQIPARYHDRSDLQAVVTEDESQNVFNFPLKSR